jgi:periplasmic divalent cation tolerance protein
MPRIKQFRVVLVTCGTLTEARDISRSVVAKRLAACANIVLSPLESFFTWKGRVEKDREYLLILKTTASRLRALEKEVKHLHSYDIAEFLVLPVSAGSKAYLRWLTQSVSKQTSE